MTKLTIFNPATNELVTLIEDSQDIDRYIDWAEQEGWIIIETEDL